MNLLRLNIIILLFSFTMISSLLAAKVFRDPDNNNRVTLLLENDEVAIFGYGSLMLREQLHSAPNADDDIYSGPFIKTQLSGFKRSWSARSFPTGYYLTEEQDAYNDNDTSFTPKSVTFLNIEPKPNSTVNGMIFVSPKSELESYDLREAIYNRINVTDKVNIRVLGGNVFAYTAKPQYFFPTENATKNETVIMQYYVDIINEALAGLGDKFRKDYNRSTQPLPTQLVFE